jgi:hypothetical protein
MKAIKVEFIDRIKQEQTETGKSYGKPHYINKGKHFLPTQIS